MTTKKKIDVAVEPMNEARWDRIERRVLEERDLETRAPANLRLRPWPRRLAVATTIVGAALAGMLLVVVLRPRGVVSRPPSGPVAREGEPTVVITPPEAGTTLRLGDAVVVVSADTAVAVRKAADGTITLELGRGAVDCDVEPRPGRAPFLVRAGDVTVTVVGTRFTVARPPGGEVSVEVLRGKVKVASPRGETQVAAGESWRASSGLAVLEKKPAPKGPETRVPDESSAPDPNAAPPPAAPDGAGATALAETAALAARDPAAAAERYTELARGKDVDAAEALYRLAMLERDRGRLDAAIAAATDYERRFPGGARLEELLWLRVGANCAAYRSDAAAAAARAYLSRFPTGAHAARARADAVCSDH